MVVRVIVLDEFVDAHVPICAGHDVFVVQEGAGHGDGEGFFPFCGFGEGSLVHGAEDFVGGAFGVVGEFRAMEIGLVGGDGGLGREREVVMGSPDGTANGHAALDYVRYVL